MADRIAPARTRRIRAAAAAGCCALVLALTAAACSGDHANASDAAGRAGSSASATQFGTVDANPSDTPEIQPSLRPGHPVPSGYRALPSVRQLSVAWDWSSWLAHAQAVAGAKATRNDWHDPVEDYKSWRWTTTQVGQNEVGVQTMLPSGMPEPTCSSTNFEPSAAKTVAEITDVLLMCVRTGLSGAAESDAEAWLRTQVKPELTAVNGVTDGRQVVSATPSFGGITYFLSAHYTRGYGYVIALQVW